MAETLSTDQKNEFPVDEASRVSNGMADVLVSSNGVSRNQEIPLRREAVHLAVSCIPPERDAELLWEMAEAAAANDAEKARNIVLRWAMIGSFYADPDRKENHPLNKVFGVFKDEPLWEELMEKIRARHDTE